MQFVKNGPDIPDRLLQTHEDGEVVFFCGAGISIPAGLPGFAGLVEKVYDILNEQPSTSEQTAIKSKHFDRTIGLLEGRIIEGRTEVRNCLPLILKPNLQTSVATTTHEALLTLGRNREGRTRLITTNFDRLFERVISDKHLNIEQFKAPHLPLIKNQWEGIVYLHGLLPEITSETELNRLVLSSGDFGLAYLTERWAARFVSNLFRNFTVCFVGYSIDDPVLRYMMDALAADLLLGEAPIEMFAFGSYSKNRKDQCEDEWKSKNVTPILYRKFKRHWYLRQTLREWANVYRDNVSGKESIVAQFAHLLPMGNSKQDNFVGRILWSLRDTSGLPAKRFANIDPVPPLEWIEVFLDDRYRHEDLRQFGVTPDTKPDKNLQFSLLCRPTPYTLAQSMALFDRSILGGWNDGWDKVMCHLAHWLLRHLDDPKLLLWLTSYDLPIHPNFATQVAEQLENLGELERIGNAKILSQIRKSAPNAVPRPAMRTLWSLLLAGRIISHSPIEFYCWGNRFNQNGLTITLRRELRDALEPRISVHQQFELDDVKQIPDAEKKPKDLVDVEIVLASNYVYDDIDALGDTPIWIEVLPDLLDDFCALLQEAMDLAREIGEAKDGEDISWYCQPSIDIHEQNSRSYAWTVLIELSRDAWLATARTAPKRSALIARNWLYSPYPVFRRLAYFAAAKSLEQQSDSPSLIQPEQALDWLLEDEHHWLWSHQTRRESMRLLIVLAPLLNRESLTKLERAVLKGPPRDMRDANLSSGQRDQIVELRIFQRLIRIVNAGATLGRRAQGKLDDLVTQHPDWNREPKDSDEFAIWTGDSDELIKSITSPKNHLELIEWLKQHPSRTDWYIDDDWRRHCREDFDTTSDALCALADQNNWPVERWREALNAWSTNKLAARSWKKVMPVLCKMPDDALQEVSHGIGSWLTTVPEITDIDEEIFFRLCLRILNFDYQHEVDLNTDDLATKSYNHPVGYVTMALMSWWFRYSPKDEEGLPDKLVSIITKLCNTRVVQFRYGRLLLVSHTFVLFRVDREWTKSNLLPLFDWNVDALEAHAVWTGYLKSPSMYAPLTEAMKYHILKTASHYQILGRYGDLYVDFLTYIALLNPSNIFTKQQLAKATGTLPEKGLIRTASTLYRALDSTGEQRTEYWRNRVQPYMKLVWPKSNEHLTPKVSQKLGELCIGANNVFPESLKLLRRWLMPLPRVGRIFQRLNQSGICSKYPKEALDFLDLVTGEPPWGDDFNQCLQKIKSVSPELEDSPSFKKLVNRFRSTGGNW